MTNSVMEMTDRAAGWFWVLENRRFEWQSDRLAPALNIHSNVHQLWITEKLVDGQRWFWWFLFTPWAEKRVILPEAAERLNREQEAAY